jgi:hypothetical protein
VYKVLVPLYQTLWCHNQEHHSLNQEVEVVRDIKLKAGWNSFIPCNQQWAKSISCNEDINTGKVYRRWGE